jgi:hypothetical protein
VPLGQAVQEEFFLRMPDPEDGGTTLSERAQTGCYTMSIVLIYKGVSRQSIILIYRPMSG